MLGAWIYIVTNRRDGTLFVGVTSNIAQRIWQHKEGLVEGFTKRYNLKRLVYVEHHDDIRNAIQREKNFKTLVSRLEGGIDCSQQPRLE
jgi:putative endonuclease